MTSTDTKVLEMSIEANIHIRALICLVVAALQLEGFIAMGKKKWQYNQFFILNVLN